MKRYIKSEDELKPTYSVLVYRCRDDDIRVFHDLEGAKHYANWQVRNKNTALARICIGDDYGNPIYQKMDKDN